MERTHKLEGRMTRSVGQHLDFPRTELVPVSETQDEIRNWLRYWRNARAIDLAAIQSLEHVRIIRTVPQFSGGVFCNISDEQFWSAVQAEQAA